MIIDKVSEDVSEAREKSFAWIHVLIFRRVKGF